MRRNSRSAILLGGVALVSLLVVACGATAAPPEVSKIESQFTEVSVGETVLFSVEASGAELEFEWTAARGTIEPKRAAAEYTAPDSPGEDTVQVHVTSKGETVVRSLTFKVVAPTEPPSPPPTATPAATETLAPMPTDTPAPVPTDTAAPTPTDTAAPTPTDTLTPAPTQPPTRTPLPTPETILGPENILVNWMLYDDGKGSTIRTSPAAGIGDTALKISYNVVGDGWVGMAREDVSPSLAAAAKGVQFTYSGSGAPSTIELKLIRAARDGKEAIWSLQWGRATATEGWVTLKGPYAAFECWEDTGCAKGEPLDPAQIIRIDFAISNKPGDTAGAGEIILNDVRPLP
jgi:hypothetical protein